MLDGQEQNLRYGLVVDPSSRKAFDSSFWHGDTANLVYDTAKDIYHIGDTGLVGSVSSYSQYLFGDFEFQIGMDTLSPDSNDSEKRWGLQNIGDTGRRGAIYFQAAYDSNTDTTVTRQLWATMYSESGTLQRKRITWDSSWDTTYPRYRITWESDGARFLINDTVYATLGDKPDSANAVFQINTTIPQALRISNRSLDTSDTNPTSLKFLAVRNSRMINPRLML
jgi:hypothetical protein